MNKPLLPVEEDLTTQQREDCMKCIDQELKLLQSECQKVNAMYNKPTDLASFREQLTQQQAFTPKLKAFLKKEFSKRHEEILELAQEATHSALNWHEQVKKQEEVAVDRAELDHQPNTHHISSLLRGHTGQHSQQHPQAISLTRPNRRADIARSEEEMDRIIQSLIEQDRDNPETRWLATAAVPPNQFAASSKCLFHDTYSDYNRAITSPNGVPENTLDWFEGVWSDAEERVFIEKYAQSPKDFRRIAAALPFKTTAQCIRFYYKSKRRFNLKALVGAMHSGSSISGSTSSISSRKRSSVISFDDQVEAGKRIK